jgi:hypothetical protein
MAGALETIPDQESTHPSISDSSPAQMEFSADRFVACLLGMLMVYAAVVCCLRAAIKPLWFDEICTFIMVHQPNLSTLWSALNHGADIQPPGFYGAERFATALIANENISFRWLSIAGFLCTCVCLFVLIRKRRGSTIALLCAAISMLISLYKLFSIESRPYSLVVACIASALVCYQRAPAVRWMILMGLTLALAQSFQYNAAIAFLPFFARESVFHLAKRQVRWPVWLAMGSGFLPLVSFWTLLWHTRAIYSAHVWSPSSLQIANQSYGVFLSTDHHTGFDLAVLTALVVLVNTLLRARRGARGESSSEAMFQEPIIILALLSLPYVTLVLTKLAHGGFAERHALPAVLGFPLALSYLIPRFEQRRRVLLSALGIFIFVLGYQEVLFWSSYDAHFFSLGWSTEEFLRPAGHADLPIVLSDAIIFLQVAHYASPEWNSRFVLLVDAPQSLNYLGQDSADRELPILASYYPLHVYDYKDFAKARPTFLVYSTNGGMGRDWWPRKLKDDGYTLKTLVENPLVPSDLMYHLDFVFLASRSKTAN